MAAFGRERGFQFLCHERGHANRNQNVSYCAS
jgi:hypothetical protein